MVSLVMSRMLVETTLNLVARSGEARAKRIMFSQCRSTDVQEGMCCGAAAMTIA